MVEKNEIITLNIHDLGACGEGVGRYEGWTLFVCGALPGETAEVKIVKTGKDYGYGKLIKIIQPSPHRAEPRCPVFSACGGCSLQHLSYEQQLIYKQKRVTDALLRIGGFNGIEAERCIGMKEPFNYRNKAQFPAGVKDGAPVFGFYSKRSHNIVPVTGCLINHPVNRDIVSAMQCYMKENGIDAYDEKTHTGLVRHLVTKVAFGTGEIMVCLVINGSALPKRERLIKRLTEIPGMHSIVTNENRNRTNVIMGEKTSILWGQGYITDEIGLKFMISPLSFYQVNPAQTRVLYEKVLEFADIKSDDIVFDAYCGIGTISLFLARKAKMVYGIESVPEAVRDARANAELNGIGNAEFICGKSEEVIGRLCFERGIKPGCVVVDPPRKGCERSLIDAMGEIKPERVVYVSCDPATLARDLRLICDKGYEIKRVLPVDCFCHSPHVETVVLISYAGNRRHE